MPRVLFIETSGLDQKMELIPSLKLAYARSYFSRSNISLECINLDVLIRKAGRPANATFIDTPALASYLFKDVASEELDEQLDRLVSRINVRGKDFIAFSISGEQDLSIFAFIKKVKEKVRLPIVIGGYIITSPNLLLEKFSFIDYVVLGPGFGSLYDLLKGKDRRCINGLCYRNKGRITVNKPVYKIEHEGLQPDFGQIEKDDYIYPFNINNTCFKNELILPFQFIFRCPGYCAYCYNSLFPYLNVKNVPEIVARIVKLKKRYGTNKFAFFNPCININNRFLDAFICELKDQHAEIVWSDSFIAKTLDRPMFKLLRSVGLIGAYFGIDSGAQSTLNYINKKVSVAEMEKCLINFHSAGIWNVVNFIIGFPYESPRNIKDTLSFLKNNRESIDSPTVNILSIIPSLFLFSSGKYHIKITGLEDYSRWRYRYRKKYQRHLELIEYFPHYKFVENKTGKGRNIESILNFKFIFDDYIQTYFYQLSNRPVRLFTLYRYFQTKEKIYEFLSSAKVIKDKP